MRILVCGGRNFDHARELAAVLERYRDRITVLIHGGARGADTLAGVWAASHRIKVLEYPVSDDDWRKLGKKAGPLRNQRMLDEGKPDLVIAFPGGDGTADMVKRANKAGVTVFEA